MTILTTPFTDELREICRLPAEEALPRAAAFVAGMIRDGAMLETEILPVLRGADGEEEWYVARRYGDEDDPYDLKVFVWPPGTGTRVHDHASWGVYGCAYGSVLEHRYERLDDGSRPEHARLKEAWRLAWSPEDGPSTVLPGDGGIHRVSNPGEGVAISVHLYGPRLGGIDGRDYDPSREYVCDRLMDE